MFPKEEGNFFKTLWHEKDRLSLDLDVFDHHTKQTNSVRIVRSLSALLNYRQFKTTVRIRLLLFKLETAVN